MSDQVLVVDDETSIVASIIAILEEHDITARGESDPRAVLENFLADPTDVVIVDYRLSGGFTGVDIIAELQPIRPYTRFILISGYIDRGVNEETLAEELRKKFLVNYVISKPFSRERLISAVQESLQEMPDLSSDWKAVAQQFTEQDTVTPEQAREVNEKIKNYFIDAVEEARDNKLSTDGIEGGEEQKP